MRNGLRRHRVLVQRLMDPPPQDPFGEPIPTWETHASRWGFVEPLEGREFFDAQQMQAAADHRILLPYDPVTAQITPTMRLTHGERLFDIQSVLNPATANAEIQVLARERL